MKLKIKSNHVEFYKNHKSAYSEDSGIDLFFPNDLVVGPRETLLIDLEVCCQMNKNGLSLDKDVGYYLYPRSSIYKTPLRMSNSVGIIDAKYRNSIKVAVDNISENEYCIKRGDRLFQICSPCLEPITVDFVSELTSSDRGEGFGSSGKGLCF